MKASLIVSFYNKIDLLKLVFASLDAQTRSDFEVIIADDGSTDEARRAADALRAGHRFEVQHVWHPDAGWTKTAILNRAVHSARTDYLIFIDGDCVLNRHFVDDHLRFAQRGKVVCGRRVLLTEQISKTLNEERVRKGLPDAALFFDLVHATLFKRQRTLMEQMFRAPRALRPLLKAPHRTILGCNFSLYKADLLKVNGFDTRYVHPGYGEDSDLEQRLANAGVYTYAPRHAMIQFHFHHQRFNTESADNLRLMEENREATRTPQGYDEMNVDN